MTWPKTLSGFGSSGPDRFGKCYRGGSNWIILAMDNRELAVVVRRQVLPFDKSRFIVNFISTVKYSERRIMKLHEEQVTALVLCVVIIGCFVVARYLWV